jgi:hypothetical protein
MNRWTDFAKEVGIEGSITGLPPYAVFVFHPITLQLKLWLAQDLAKAG